MGLKRQAKLAREEFVRQYEFEQRLLKFLAKFGITEKDLYDLPKALANQQTAIIKQVPTAEETKKIKEKAEKAFTPEDLVQMFSQDLEEFYPNGKPKKSNNN